VANETRETADETGMSPQTTHEARENDVEPGEAAGSGETAESVKHEKPKADETGETAAESGATADETPETAGETDETPQDTGEPGDADESAGAAKSGDADESAGAGESGGEPAKDTKADGSRTRLAVIVLGAAAIVLAAFGVWATLEAHSLRSGAAPQNIAVTDGAATSAVNHQIVSAVNTVFSYNYADTGATRQAAQSLLTGPAIRQYNTYFALVTKDAPAQKLVVTTRVTNSGVELLSGNRARVLVFANQQDTRAGTKQTSYAGALFAVTAVRQGGKWKIENIDTFNGQQ
jgi:Mce-associated membrane protein